MHRSSAVCIYPAKLHLTRCRGAPPEASLRAVVLPLGLVPRFCASPRRQSSVFSLPCLGWCLWLRARRLLRLQNLAPHSRHTPSLRSPRIRTERASRPRRACRAPRLWRIIRAGPSRQKLPQPTAQAWFAAYRMRLGWMVCQFLCREGLTSSRFRRAWA